MKTLLFTLLLFIASNCYSQGYVTNLQLKVGTWKAIARPFKENASNIELRQFIKLFNNVNQNNPSNNANLTLDSITVDMCAILYERMLFTVGYGGALDALGDFQTSIQSKRNTNPILDARLAVLELRLTQLEAAILAEGNKILTGN